MSAHTPCLIVLALAAGCGGPKPNKDGNYSREVHSELKKLISKGNLDDVKKYVQSHPGILNSNKASALAFAAGMSKYDIVKWMLENGADPALQNDSRDILLCTPAISNLADKNAGILLKAGADVKAKDNRGRTPADLARSDEIRELLQRGGNCKWVNSRGHGK